MRVGVIGPRSPDSFADNIADCLPDLGVDVVWLGSVRGRFRKRLDQAVEVLSRARPDFVQFIVAPECAVKQNDAGSVNGIAEFVGDLTDSRCNQRACAGNFVAELKRDALVQFNRAIREAGA